MGISCASGHDGEVAGTLIVTQDAAKTSVRVRVVEGDGPAGQFQACPAR